MKITGVETIILQKPVDHPVSDSLHTYDVGGHLLTRIYTDEGITGTALTYFGRIRSGMETVKIIIDRELAEVIRGQDPHMVRKIRNDMFVATEYYGTVGVANFAIAAVDNALWDIIGSHGAGSQTDSDSGLCHGRLVLRRRYGGVCQPV